MKKFVSEIVSAREPSEGGSDGTKGEADLATRPRRSGRPLEKIYRGKAYYFGGGRGKSDRNASQAAQEAWSKQKARLDAEAELKPKPHQAEYESAIERWSLVQLWAVRHGRVECQKEAQLRIDELQARLESRNPPPIRPEDLFEHRFEARIVPDLADLLPSSFSREDWAEIERTIPRNPIDPERTHEIMERQYPLDIEKTTEKAVWIDRLSTVQGGLHPAADSVEGNVAAFLRMKKQQVESGRVSAGRYSNIERCIHGFRDHFGGASPIQELSGRVLADYHSHLMTRVTDGDFTATYANEFMDAAKMFVR